MRAHDLAGASAIGALSLVLILGIASGRTVSVASAEPREADAPVPDWIQRLTTPSVHDGKSASDVSSAAAALAGHDAADLSCRYIYHDDAMHTATFSGDEARSVSDMILSARLDESSSDTGFGDETLVFYDGGERICRIDFHCHMLVGDDGVTHSMDVGNRFWDAVYQATNDSLAPGTGDGL